MIILKDRLTVPQLSEMATGLYVDMIKAVADVRLGLLAIDAELHSDLEQLLLENGSASAIQAWRKALSFEHWT